MPPGMSCPHCASTSLHGGAMDLANGDELQELACLTCGADVSGLRSEHRDTSAWYVDRSYPPRSPHRAFTTACDPIERALRAEIARGDDDARQVYVDWLHEREDPLGRFIELQCARSSG